MDSSERFKFIRKVTQRTVRGELSEEEFILAQTSVGVPVNIAMIMPVAELFPNSHFKYN